jgi:NAD-dependent DNA ligase
MKKPTAKDIMLAHQYCYYVLSESVWSDYEYDKFCERNGLDGNGGSDIASSYSSEIASLAKKMVSNPKAYPPTVFP